MMVTGQILLVGGSGIVGSQAAQLFRARHSDQPMLIGGRDLEKAKAVAHALGNAHAVTIDTGKPGLGLSADVCLSALVMLTPDDGLHGVRLAQDLRIPYLSIGNWLVEIGAEIAHFARRPDASAVVLASHWHGGPAVFVALATAASLDTIHSIRIGAIVDTLDPTGPAAIEDMQRADDGVSGSLAFEAGRRVWLSGDAAHATIDAIDGRSLQGNAFAPYDIVSLHAATGAKNVRFDLAMEASSSRLRGGPIATELILEIDGEVGGSRQLRRSTLEFTHGQAALTGLSVALALSTVLGLEGTPACAPGLYFPEHLLDTQWFLNQLRQAGASIFIDSGE